MSTWSKDDEHRYSEMVVRRNTVLHKRRLAVFDVVGKIWSQGISKDELIDGLIESAESVRDALAPYDSGIRCAEKEQT